jgi:hypothetical protein
VVIRSRNISYSVIPPLIPNYHNKLFYLSACTSVARPECDIAWKWVIHHYLQGVEHFTVYINDNVDYWNNCLHPFQIIGLVSLVDFTFPNHLPFYEQICAINSCGIRYRYTSEFLLQNDIDEYMVPLHPKLRFVDIIHSYDNKYPKLGAVNVYNAFHNCLTINMSLYNQQNTVDNVCGFYGNITLYGRTKTVSRPLLVDSYMVHIVKSNGLVINMDYDNDMIMHHLKMNKRGNGSNKRQVQFNPTFKKQMHQLYEFMHSVH